VSWAGPIGWQRHNGSQIWSTFNCCGPLQLVVRGAPLGGDVELLQLGPVIPPARHPGASWKIAMAVVGVVWLGSVALWMLKELDNND